MKSQTMSIRMSPEAQVILLEFQTKYGISRTAVIEMALRVMARKEGLDYETPENPHEQDERGDTSNDCTA